MGLSASRSGCTVYFLQLLITVEQPGASLPFGFMVHFPVPMWTAMRSRNSSLSDHGANLRLCCAASAIKVGLDIHSKFLNIASTEGKAVANTKSHMVCFTNSIAFIKF